MAQSNKPYSYHRQLALLAQAHTKMKEVYHLLAAALTNEVAHLGDEEASSNGYGALEASAGTLAGSIEDHLQAVKALASMCPPDPVEPFDPTDYSEDVRFQQMIDHTFDVAAGHGVEPKEVLVALATAVSEGDQR